MKSVKFILGVLFSTLLSVSAVVASGINSDATEMKASENNIRNQFESVLSNISYDGTADVFVKFTVSEENGLTIDETSSTDKYLANKVKSVLSKSSLSVPSTLNGSYLIKIKFVDSKEVAFETPSTDEIVRNTIAQKLATLDAKDGASAKVYFAVKDNSVEVKKVEGVNDSLAKSISAALTDVKVMSPETADGSYSVKVRF